MHDITDLPAWERLFKKIVWKQLGDMEGKKILDFGSGEGITANHFAEKNDVTAIEPSKEMLSNAWKDYEYTQIVGDVNALSAFKNETFDMIICHNVLEYIDDKAAVVKALARVLKDGVSYVLVFKLSRFGRNAADVLATLQVMQDFGVNLICVEDGIDSSKDAGKLMISVLSAVAEIERENIRVQTMEGRMQKAREGKWNGGVRNEDITKTKRKQEDFVKYLPVFSKADY